MAELSEEQEEQVLDPNRIPKHIAIVMDGNRRWAKQHGLMPMMGHAVGAATLEKIVKIAGKIGVEILTVYAFSTENWRRTPEEVQMLIELLQKNLKDLCPMMIEEGIRLDTIGDLEKFPESLKQEVKRVKKLTCHGKGIELILAINYGGRDDICRAVSTLLRDYTMGKFYDLNLTEDVLASYLDTAKWKDPELFIRTSGERRLSNFLLWQLSYAEIYFTDVLWPDFDEKEFYRAIFFFQKRVRRSGR